MGGVARTNENLIREIRKLQERIVTVERGPLVARLFVDKEKETMKRKEKKTRFYFNVPALVKMIHSMAYVVTSFLIVLGQFRRRRYHVMMCDDPITSGLVCNLIGRLFRIPYVLQIHGWPTDCLKSPGLVGSVGRGLRSLALTGASRVLCSFPRVIPCLLDMGVERNRIVDFPLGVDLRRFRMDEKKRQVLRTALKLSNEDVLIGFVGRLSSEKGLDEFIVSVNLANKLQKQTERRDIEAVLVGTGSLENHLRELSNDLKLRTHFLGHKTNPEDWLCAMDIYLALSRRETFGLAVAEAMATSLPVIASEIRAFEKLLDSGVTGLIVDSGNTEAVAKEIAKLASNEEVRKQIGKKAREAISAYDVHQMGSRLVKLLRSTCE